MSRDRNGPAGRALKLSLVATFLAAAGIAGSKDRGGRGLGDPVDIALTGMAAHRIGRMIAFEKVAEPLREPFTATVPDSSGADDTVVARGRGLHWALGELLSCPICVGTWAALGLTIGRMILPGPTRFVTRVLAIAGIAELNYTAVERLEWGARSDRRNAGER